MCTCVPCQARTPLRRSLSATPAELPFGKRRVSLRLLAEPDVFVGASITDVVPKLRAMQGRGRAADGSPLDFSCTLMRVTAARQLQAPHSGRFTRHVELELPQGMSYTAGEGYVCVCVHVRGGWVSGAGVHMVNTWHTRHQQAESLQ